VRVFNSLKVLDTLAAFPTIKQGPFEIQAPPDEAAVLAPAALRLLEEEIAALEKKYAVELEKPIRIQIFDNHDDFMVRSLGLPGNAGHLGICFGRLITMDSPSARPKGSTDWHAVLWHEFAHVVTLQKTKNRMPRWLSEGISVYEETLRNPGWGMRVEPHFKELLSEGLPGASELELFFTQPMTPQHLMLGYFLAGEFAAHYAETHGEAALVEALERIGRKESALEALAASAAITTDQLDEGFRQHLKQRLAVLDNLPAFLEAMRRGFEAAAREAWEEAESAFREARELYPEYGNEDGPLAQLAKVYEATGQADKLEETLRTQLMLDTASLPAWRRLAELYKEKQDWSGVVYAAAGGAGVDPFDVELGRALLDAQRALAAREDALATAERLTALDAPRALEYRLVRARLLTDLGRWDEARQSVVRLLEERPHYWEAQELLLAIAEQGHG
jgi:tetratricopeptide (TPR) repeat protein